MTAKSTPSQNRKSPKSAPRLSKRTGSGTRSQHAKPAAPDYENEVTSDQLRQIRDAVREDVEREELEIVDGPGW